MHLIQFTIRMFYRNKLRAFFVVGLLTLGLLAIVGSIMFSELSVQTIEHSIVGRAPLIVSKNNSQLLVDDLNKIKDIKGVYDAVGLSSYTCLYNNQPSILMGFTGNFVNNAYVTGIGRINLMEGAWFDGNPNEVILTKESADLMHVKVKDKFIVTNFQSNTQNTIYTPTDNGLGSDHVFVGTLDSEKLSEVSHGDSSPKIELKVVGIIDNLQGINGIVQINDANHILYNSSNFSFDYIAINPDNNKIEQIENEIKQYNPSLIVIRNKDLFKGFKLMLMYVTFFFVGIGTIIMMITTLKSVSERTREIGVLKAIGWSNKRVIGAIISETFIQLFLAWIATLTILTIIFLLTQNANINFLNENSSLVLYILSFSFALSLLMPLLGCLLPLIRIIRLKPTEALKYE